MMRSNQLKTLLFAVALVFTAGVLFSFMQKPKPVLYLVGDSTVKNGKGKGDGGLWGWGNYLGTYFDTTKITVENDALGGTSSRTFQTQGWWDKVLVKIKPGDYVIMQFGHNDASPLVDSSRARGTIKNNSDEQQELYNPLTKKNEVIHSYGWYLRKMINEAKAKGATVAVCSLIPRDNWKDSKVNRSTDSYVLWASQAAKQAGATFIDLNALVADVYDQEGEAKVRSTYFTTTDHTHTSEAGAKLNAQLVAKGIKNSKGFSLSKYLAK
ncbi:MULTISPECIES: rhamnogalacturonan acetylesterase [unclassified Mucilaginibacter]|uniref:rhamnogalacturonan acetylesterase n=1 Tax=unclassified Mucilaginibacter TaxID=2617802 RepID=UPI0031F6F7FA